MSTQRVCADCPAYLPERAGKGRPRKRCELCAPPRASLARLVACAGCGRQVLRSARSRPEGELRCDGCRASLTRVDRTCIACGGTYRNGEQRVLTCCRTCGGRAMIARRQGVPLVVVPLADLPAYRRIQNALNCARKQTRRAEAFVEDVDPLVVFVRDRWRCHLCGDRVDWLLPRKSRRGATLDHMIPLAEGGEHSYANTALAHLSCNSSKGKRLHPAGEQLALV